MGEVQAGPHHFEGTVLPVDIRQIPVLKQFLAVEDKNHCPKHEGPTMAGEELRMAELLAKPDTPLMEHLREVTGLGNQIAQRLCLTKPLHIKAILACALHDIGKATKEFQK